LRVLLVEPEGDGKYIPLGLAKLSTYYKEKGADVEYVKGLKNLPEEKFDKVFISSLFTWNVPQVIEIARVCRSYISDDVIVGGIAATMLANEIESSVDVKVVRGCMPEIDNCRPDYSLFPDIDYSIGYTTRGCPRRCAFCGVWKIEPKYYEISDWTNWIDVRKPRIIILDNNILATSDKHFKDVVKKLVRYGKAVDFNTGIDCRLLTEDKAKMLSLLDIPTVRLAFDTMKSDGHIQRAIELTKKYITRDVTVYCLYNHNDDPSDFWYRLNKLNECRVNIYPMKFIDYTIDGRNYIGEKWTKQLLKGFDRIMSTFRDGMIGAGCNRKRFELMFGRGGGEFVEKLEGSIDGQMGFDMF